MTDLVLAVDAAAGACSACLRAGGVTSVLRTEARARGHAERLPVQVQEIFAETGWRPKDVRRVVTTIGPGSFTGVRTGVAFARAFAAALGPPDARPPVFGVTTLACLAWAARRGAPNVAVAALMDARRGQVYAQAFAPGGAELNEPAVLGLEEARAYLTEALAGREYVSVGSGAALVGGYYAARALEDVTQPNAEAAAALANVEDMLRPPTPLYLRPPDAKEQGPAPFAPRAA